MRKKQKKDKQSEGKMILCIGGEKEEQTGRKSLMRQINRRTVRDRGMEIHNDG